MSTKNHKGQSMVEFAFIIPLFMLMCFAIIYGGIFFMDYLQYNRTAGDIARDISLSSEERRESLIELSNNKKLNNLTGSDLYTVTSYVKLDDSKENVIVEIKFKTNYGSLPAILSKINFPPESITPVVVEMPLKK